MLTLRKYWSRPQNGQFVSYKEIAGFSVGGVGVKSFASFLGFMQLSATCLFTAVVYGLTPNEILILFLITNVLVGTLKTPIISWLQDRTNTPIGKFRPYLIWAGIPCVLAIIGLTWLVPIPGWILPKGVSNKALTMTMVCIFVNILTISQQLLNNAYMGISQTISPISAERTKIMGFSEFLGNLGPSLVQLILPICGMIFAPDGDGALRTPWTYRVFMPLFAVIGFALGLIVLYTSKERTSNTDDIKSIKEKKKSKENKLGFFTSLKLLAKNKEFWLITISKFFDGFKGMLTMLLPWICAYQFANDSGLGIVQTIVSFGFTPGIILAPLFVKWMGSRGAGLFSHLLNVAASLLMLFTFKSGPVVLLIALFFYNFACGPQYIIQNTVMSDGFDYQQDRDGVRIEGFAQNFQLMVSTLGTVASTLVLTFILNSHNVGTVVNGEANYDMLKDAAVRNPVYAKIIFTVVIASLLASIPYLFVTLNKNKMAIIRENLDRKKVIADNNLENATEEEIEIAYNKFLEEKEAERLAEIALAEKEKAKLEAKNQAEKEANDAFLAELEELRAKIIADGGSAKDANSAVKAKKTERKLALKEQHKQEKEAITKERKELAQKRKEFVKEWKVNAQVEHEKICLQAKQDIADAKSTYTQKMQEYKTLLANEELVNKYKQEAIQIKNSCLEKSAIYKAEKSEKLVAENARFAEDKAKIAELKTTFAPLKAEFKSKLAEFNDNYNNTTRVELAELDAKLKATTDKSEKEEIANSIKEIKKNAVADKKAIKKDYNMKRDETIKQIDRLSFAHTSAISKISVDFNTKKDALKKEKANANKLKAIKKEIVANKKDIISDAKHKSQSIKLWLNVLANEAFAELLTEETLNSATAE